MYEIYENRWDEYVDVSKTKMKVKTRYKDEGGDDEDEKVSNYKSKKRHRPTRRTLHRW